MVRSAALHIAVFPTVAALAMDATDDHLHLLRAHVTFLAICTTVHGSLGKSQDVYLIEITEGENDQPILARRMDEYPGYRSALQLEIVTSRGTLRVRRDRWLRKCRFAGRSNGHFAERLALSRSCRNLSHRAKFHHVTG